MPLYHSSPPFLLFFLVFLLGAPRRELLYFLFGTLSVFLSFQPNSLCIFPLCKPEALKLSPASFIFIFHLIFLIFPSSSPNTHTPPNAFHFHLLHYFFVSLSSTFFFLFYLFLSHFVFPSVSSFDFPFFF